MTIEKKLAQLRKQWVKYPHKRDIIELQAEILKWKPNDYVLKEEKEEKRFAQDVLDTLSKWLILKPKETESDIEKAIERYSKAC